MYRVPVYTPTYNPVGQVTEVDIYDFGSVGSGTAGPLLSKVVTGYPQTYYGYSDTDTPYIINSTTYPGSVKTYDGSGNMIHEAIPTYGNDGLIHQLQQWVSGSTYLTTQYGYYANGLPYSVTDPNGAITYTYYTQCVDPNNPVSGYWGGYPSGTSTVVKNAAGTQTATLTTSETWDCVAGVPTASTDVNGNPSSATYNDPLFRKTSSKDWLGNTTTYSYPTATSNTSETVMAFNSGASTQDVLVKYDGLGRPILSQTRQSPTATTFDTVSMTYDSYGRAYSTSLPYAAAAGVVNTSIAKSKTTYDSLSRPQLVTDAAGGTTQYTYTANDTLITSGPAPTGENLKSRQLEYNAAGQLTSVCETTSGTQSGACSQNTAATGYFTKYTYDGDMLTKVSQNTQSGGSFSETRTMSYDGLGRKLSETIPETGTSTFVYDSDSAGACSGSFPGDRIKSTDAVGNVTCGTYDNQHRLLKTTVVSGAYASVTPTLNYVYDAATVDGTAMKNAAGALAEAYTCSGSCTAKITDAGFSSAAETSGSTLTGRIVSHLYESTPHSNGYSVTLATSYPNGAPGALSGSGSSYTMPSVTYGLDGEGRPATATDGTHSLNLVTSTAYNVAGEPTTITYGNSDTDTPGYDTFYRPTGFTFAVAGSSPFKISGALTLNTNSTVKSMSITDTNDTSKNQTCSYSSDDLNRLYTANCGSVWSQTFTYNPFGNISKTANGGTTYAATYGAKNQVNGGTTATYDANGNQTLSTAGSFTWNAAAQMISTTAGAGATATYDALGRMVETVSGSSNTQFVYSPLGTQYAVVQNGTLLRGLVPLPGGDTAVYNSAGMNYIRRTDVLGSSRLATTWAHAIYSKDAYAPYGEPYDETATTDRSFTGQDSDLTQNAGLYDFQFRKLDTTAGRWISPDPSGWSAVDLTNPQTLNRYAYAGNSPLTSVDPLGLDSGEDYGNPCYSTINGAVGASYSAQCAYFEETNQAMAARAAYLYQTENINGQAYNAYDNAIANGYWSQTVTNFYEYSVGLYDITGMTVTSYQSASLYNFSSENSSNNYFSYFGYGGGAGGGSSSGAPNNCISPGVCKSKIDNMNLMEKGKTSYRDPFSICSTHTTVDNSTGATNSHVDLFNPGTSLPTMNGSIPLLPFHLLFDAFPDFVYNKTGFYPWPAGRTLCQ